jgi:hypothetical protein
MPRPRPGIRRTHTRPPRQPEACSRASPSIEFWHRGYLRSRPTSQRLRLAEHFRSRQPPTTSHARVVVATRPARADTHLAVIQSQRIGSGRPSSSSAARSGSLRWRSTATDASRGISSIIRTGSPPTGAAARLSRFQRLQGPRQRPRVICASAAGPSPRGSASLRATRPIAYAGDTTRRAPSSACA